MNTEDERDIIDDRQNIIYKRYRYRSRDPNLIYEEIEAHPKTNKGKETMRDREEISFNSLINYLNDLVRVKKEIMEFMGRLEEKGLENQNEHQNNWSNNGEGV